MEPKKKALIVGCGYTGIRLGKRLRKAGFHVLGTASGHKRIVELQHSGIEPLVGSLRSSRILARIKMTRPTLVAYFVPPQNSSQNVLAEILAAVPNPSLEAFLYASSSSVYGDCGGEWIDETTPVIPSCDDDAKRYAAELEVVRAGHTFGMPTRICRVSVIYGPGRTLKEPLESGSYTLVENNDPWMSRIHIEDLITGLIAAWQKGADGEVYNLVDQEPHRASEFANMAADLNRMPRPKYIKKAEAERRYNLQLLHHKLANRRVRCKRLIEELAVQLKYPSYTTGLPAAIADDRKGRVE